ncbi:MAG TPA: glycosyltransferase family 2 protein [Clostridia bacterium]|nr:glycosyltransferase family 2 protein [Clostridia bacterium]
MKLSILTSTYNRGEYLTKLYNSIVENLINDVFFEWIIMDDGSTDNTYQIVSKFSNTVNFEIKYFYQDNRGKMIAINKLVERSDGDLIVECDSDDFFMKDAFKIIKEEYDKCKSSNDLYAMCFLKLDQNNNNIGKNTRIDKTTIFDLYFKQEEDGEKALVFFSSIRKKYKHKLEKNEKFITEGRLYHEMDKNYFIKCINKPIMICEYQNDGYTKNIDKFFLKNPYGYYEYFAEILGREMKNVLFCKRMYAIKHYILFSYLTKTYNIKRIKEYKNKFLYIILLFFGIIKIKISHKFD